MFFLIAEFVHYFLASAIMSPVKTTSAASSSSALLSPFFTHHPSGESRNQNSTIIYGSSNYKSSKKNSSIAHIYIEVMKKHPIRCLYYSRAKWSYLLWVVHLMRYYNMNQHSNKRLSRSPSAWMMISFTTNYLVYYILSVSRITH